MSIPRFTFVPGSPKNTLFIMEDINDYSAHLRRWREMSAAEVKADLAALAGKLKEQDKGMLLSYSIEDWMKKSSQDPSPRMLFSEFWHEGELCILFSDTNLGKSILAVQIGDSISRGVPIEGFKLEAQPQPVIYFDFELSAKQFEARYSINYQDHHSFDSSFYRAEMNPDAEIPDGYGCFEEMLNNAIEEEVLRLGVRILIIDNLTYLKNETEKAHNALPLMKHLKTLKQRHNLSILALAHTPKRDPSRPLLKNDLQGSKMLINFCDSAFAIGESYADKGMRYLKQIKQRYTEAIYDENHVVLCQTVKPDNFLMFAQIGYGADWEHLKRFTNDEQAELEQQVKEIMTQEPQITISDVARRLCTDDKKFNTFRIRIQRITMKLRSAA